MSHDTTHSTHDSRAKQRWYSGGAAVHVILAPDGRTTGSHRCVNTSSAARLGHVACGEHVLSRAAVTCCHLSDPPV
jgi:hypothetical protein